MHFISIGALSSYLYNTVRCCKLKLVTAQLINFAAPLPGEQKHAVHLAIRCRKLSARLPHRGNLGVGEHSIPLNRLGRRPDDPEASRDTDILAETGWLEEKLHSYYDD